MDGVMTLAYGSTDVCRDLMIWRKADEQGVRIDLPSSVHIEQWHDERGRICAKWEDVLEGDKILRGAHAH